MDISIIVTCYNDGIFLPECLESIEAVKQNLELIIVNDGSNDIATINYLDSLQKKGYTVINKKNGGVGTARNLGISMAKNELILLVDADDCIEPTFIPKAQELFNRKNSTDVVYGNVCRFGQSTGEFKPGEFDKIRLLSGNFISISAVFKKDLWEKVGGFDTTLGNYEDWEFWLRLASINASFVYIDSVSLHYRDRENSKSFKSKTPSRRRKIVRDIISKNKSIYAQNYSEVIAHLHLTIAHNESYQRKLEAALEKSNQLDLLKQVTSLEQEVEDLKNYYEKSIFWRLKLTLEKLYK